MSNAPILRETLELVLSQDDLFPQRFYDILFERHPVTKAMFHRSSGPAQNKMFAKKLTALVDHIDDPSWLNKELATLAANHVAYGVTEEMYPWVGEALFQTLAEACGDAWTAEAERAWTEAYASLTRAILSAT